MSLENDPSATPLVGRERLLEEILAGVTDGGGVLLVGPMGVGKTRLVSEVVARLEAAGHLSRRAMTSASTSSIPFGALSELLPTLATPDLRLLLEAVRHRIVDQAAGRPLLLVVDDAHHLDDQSAALLHRMLVTRSVGMLLAQRSDEPLSPTLTGLWKDGHVVRMRVPSLSRRAQDTLLETMLGSRAGPALADDLWHRAKGNPLFLRELVLSARDGYAISSHDGEWILDHDIELPDRLVEIVKARLSRLDPEMRHGLEVIAVGEPIGLPVVARVVDLEVLAELERRGLVSASSEGSEPALMTGHPLQGEIVRASLPAATVTRVRRELASALHATMSLSAPDAIRAVEWTLDAGGAPDLELCVRAAGAALARSDPARAERFARAALQRDGESPVATRLLGSALSAQGAREAATSSLRRAIELSTSDAERVDAALACARHFLWMLRDLGGADEVLREAVDLVGSSGGQAELHSEQAIIRAVAGDLAAAIDTAQQVLEAPEASERAVLTALVQSTLARCMLGQFEGLVDDIRRGQHLAAGLREAEPLAATQLEITRLMYQHYVGIDEAARDARAEHAAAQQEGRPAGLWSATWGWTEVDRGAAPEVIDLARRALAEAERFDPFNMGAMSRCLLAIGLGLGGRPEAARDALAAVGPPASLEPRTRAWFDRAETWIAAAYEEFDRAAQLALDGGQRAITAGLRTWSASLLFDAVRVGHPNRVSAVLRDLACDTPPPLVRAFAHSAVGAAEEDSDRLQDAAEQLVQTGALAPAAATLDHAGQVVRQDRPGHAERLHLRAWILREHCRGHQEPRRLRPRLTLTSREAEIACRAAHGTASKSIAATLGVSTRTVDNHLARAYRKLGVSGRAELRKLVPEAALSSGAPPPE